MTRAARILIVEDEIIVAIEVQSHLERRGYVVVDAVTTGEEAVERAQALAPDVVLLDIGLDGAMDGVEAACQMQAAREHPLLVIFLTAYGDERTRRRAEAAAPFGYLIKPFDARDLFATLEAALRRHPVA